MQRGSGVPADSIAIEAPPRTEASTNGARASERAPKKRMLIIVLRFLEIA
jgi:hypothetical protein